MTSKTKSKSLYEDLRQHYHIGLQRKEVMQILELMFTPAEAELALAIPEISQGRIRLEDLAQKVDKGEAELWSTLESLLSKGILYMEWHQDDGREVYCLWNWGYSLSTPMFGDGILDDTKRKVAELREKLWDAGLSYHNYPSTYPGGGRIMPYEPMLDSASQVHDYERYSHYINNAERICVAACGCRMWSVDRCAKPVWTCMQFDRHTEYWIKYRRAIELTKEEALQKIEDSVREGLVVTGQNYQEQAMTFCLCCRECCVILRPFIENFNTNAVARSNYLPEWDLEKCKVCSICRRACPVGAIGHHLSHEEGEGDHMIVMPDRCIGCGVCSAVCPREAITLKRVREAVPEPTAEEAVARSRAERVW